MTRDQAMAEFRALVERYGSSEWLGEIPREVFERMVELTAILVEAERRERERESLVRTEVLSSLPTIQSRR